MSNEVTKQAEEIAGSDFAAEETKTSVGSPAANNTTDASMSQDEDFLSILEKFEQEQTKYHAGDIVTGKVIEVSDRGVVIDFGYKAEGVVAPEEFASPTGEISVKAGDEVEVLIKAIHGGDAPPILSFRDAMRRQSWGDIEKDFLEGNVKSVRVIDKTKGGLKVEIAGVEAFLPGSQIDSRPVHNLDQFIGRDLDVKIIKFSRKRNNIVVSARAITDEQVNADREATMSKLDIGYVLEGTVKNLTEYGAFVDIGGLDGLLHVTDMAWGRVNKPSDVLKAGDELKVKVLKIDREKGKVSLGLKQLVPDPWSSVIEIYPVGSKIEGKVSSVTDYGAFVELEPGVEGLVHVSEMSWSKRSKSPKTIVKTGDVVEVQVLGVDSADRRISLGMRQLQQNPWELIAGKYRVGMTVSGKVRNITDFGAFVEIEEGIDGLVHVSDISWSKKIKHAKDVLKKGQDVEAVISNIDIDQQRLSLSIKDLTPSAWDNFTQTHRPGDTVTGKISRFAGFGVFVELADDLEGLCHISELSDERVDNPETLFQVGQELEFKILRIERDTQKIGLSARSVGKDDEPIVDTRSYSTEAKGGMASLGELANLKFGTKTDEDSSSTAAEGAAAE
jgi:small subunit ribosomal protein S1